MNTQSVKSAAVKMLAAGAMLATTTFADDYQGARVRGRIFLPEGIYYYPRKPLVRHVGRFPINMRFSMSDAPW